MADIFKAFHFFAVRKRQFRFGQRNTPEVIGALVWCVDPLNENLGLVFFAFQRFVTEGACRSGVQNVVAGFGIEFVGFAFEVVDRQTAWVCFFADFDGVTVCPGSRFAGLERVYRTCIGLDHRIEVAIDDRRAGVIRDPGHVPCVRIGPVNHQFRADRPTDVRDGVERVTVGVGDVVQGFDLLAAADAVLPEAVGVVPSHQCPGRVGCGFAFVEFFGSRRHGGKRSDGQCREYRERHP